MTVATSPSPDLVRQAVARFLLAPPVLILMFFVPAGTWRYWEAWVYMVALLVPFAFGAAYLIRNHPDLVERRLHYRESEKKQQRIVVATIVPFIIGFLLPGLDHRFGWSNVAPVVVLAADVMVVVGYCVVFLVLRENEYAARVVAVEAEQKVISSGPYSVVRHPMYVGVLLMFLASPVALGSYWAAAVMLPVVWTIVARIGAEEETLLRELPGYTEYRARVRYRLVPGLW